MCSDSYVHDPTATTNAGVIGSMVNIWDMTNDPTCLDVAYDYGNIVVANGIYNQGSDARNGMILDGPYVVSTGENKSDGPPASDLYYLDATVSLLQGYVACKNYDATHSPARYPDISNWLPRLVVSAQTLASLKRYFSAGDHGNWDREPNGPQLWFGLGADFSDGYGYIGNRAVAGMKALSKLSALTVEQPIRTALMDLLQDGASHYIDQWEQAVLRGAPANGDSERVWIPYAYLMSQVPSEAARYADQLKRAATHALRHQYGQGYWVSAAEGCFQQVGANAAGRLYTPHLLFPWGMSNVFAINPLPTALRDDWLAIFDTMHAVSVPRFKAGNGTGYGYNRSYLTSLNDDADSADLELGFNETFLAILRNLLDAVPSALPPKVETSVTPQSFATPLMTGTNFQFTVKFPTATDQADLLARLNNTVKVVQWQQQGSEWTDTNLWPSSPSLFAVGINEAQKKVSLLLVSPIMPGAGEFKFDVHAWDEHGQWTRDTSYQDWQ